MPAPEVPPRDGLGEPRRRRNLIDVLVLLPAIVILCLLATMPGTDGVQGHFERLLVLWTSFCLLLFAGTSLGLSLTDGNATNIDAAAVAAAFGLAIAANVTSQPATGFALLAVAHAAQGAWDMLGLGSGKIPDDQGRRRIRLTLAMVGVLIAAIFLTA